MHILHAALFYIRVKQKKNYKKQLYHMGGNN